MTNDERAALIELDDEPILYPDQPELPDAPPEPVRVGLWYGIYGV